MKDNIHTLITEINVCATGWVNVIAVGNPKAIEEFYKLLINLHKQNFKGIIDSIRIFNKSLSEKEIKKLYKKSKWGRVITHYA